MLLTIWLTNDQKLNFVDLFTLTNNTWCGAHVSYQCDLRLFINWLRFLHTNLSYWCKNHRPAGKSLQWLKLMKKIFLGWMIKDDTHWLDPIFFLQISQKRLYMNWNDPFFLFKKLSFQFSCKYLWLGYSLKWCRDTIFVFQILFCADLRKFQDVPTNKEHTIESIKETKKVAAMKRKNAPTKTAVKKAKRKW